MPLHYSNREDPHFNGLKFSIGLSNVSKLMPNEWNLQENDLFNKFSKEVDRYKNLNVSAVYLFDNSERMAYCSRATIAKHDSTTKEYASIFINRKILSLPENQVNFIFHHEIGHILNKNTESVIRKVENVAQKACVTSMASVGWSLGLLGANSLYSNVFGGSLINNNEVLSAYVDKVLPMFSVGSALATAATMLACNLTYRFIELSCDYNGHKHSKTEGYPSLKKISGNEDKNFEITNLKQVLKKVETTFLKASHPFKAERNAFIKILNAKDKLSNFVDKMTKGNTPEGGITL